MTTDLAMLPNIGPGTAAMLKEVGIDGVAALEATGAVDAYRRLKFRFPRQVSLNALWALQGALTGVPWTALEPDEKRRLKAQVSSSGKPALDRDRTRSENTATRKART